MQAALDLDKLWGAEVDFPTSWAYKIFSTRSASKDFLCFLRLKESERAREGPTTPLPFRPTTRTGNEKRRTLRKSNAEDIKIWREDLWMTRREAKTKSLPKTESYDEQALVKDLCFFENDQD